MELIKVVLTTIMVNVTYLIPLLDYMQKEYKVSNSAQNASIQTQGAFFAQIFSLLPVGDGVSLSVVENLSNPNEITVSLGLVAWIGIGLFLVYILFDLRKRVLDLGDHIERNTVYLLFAMSMIAILVSTIVFPWDTFGEKLGTFKSIFTSIQFPWRYLSVASVFLVFGIVVIINSDIFQQDLLSLLGGGQQYINILCIGILSVVLVIAGNFTSKEITGGNYSYLIAACDLDDKKIMGAEYIPLGVNEDILLDLQEPEAKGTLINGYEVNNRDICLDLSQADGEGNVSVPRIYYKGYKVKLDNIKGWKNCYSDEVGRVYFQVPEGYEGQAVVRFVEPWYWRSAEIISLITVIAIGCWAHKRKKY